MCLWEQGGTQAREGQDVILIHEKNLSQIFHHLTDNMFMWRTLMQGLWQALMGIFTRLWLSAVSLCCCRQGLLPQRVPGRCEYALVPQLPWFKAHTWAQAIAAANAQAEASRDSQGSQFYPCSSEASLVLSNFFLRIFRNNGNRITDFWTSTIKTVYHWIEKRGSGFSSCLIKWNNGSLWLKISRSGILIVLLFSPLSSEITPC